MPVRLVVSENDLTAALGFTLARVPEFAARLLAELGAAASTEYPVIRMEVADSAGRTDLEIDTGDALYVIEAKPGWLLPSRGQLGAYAPPVTARGAGPCPHQSSGLRHAIPDQGVNSEHAQHRHTSEAERLPHGAAARLPLATMRP